MVQIAVQLALSAALSYAASRLLQKRDKSIARNDSPTTLSTRGSYVPLLIGRRRVAPVFTWASRPEDRVIKKERISGGGKGTPKPEQDIWYDQGQQAFCVGPAHRLHRILQSGKPIFEGPIDSLSHPSGSLVDAGREGKFFVYWGERDQPINTRLGASNRIGISSRWPFFFYLDWLEKRLGTSPTWPLLECDLETRPYHSGLALTPAWIEPTRTLSAAQHTIFSSLSGGVGVAQIQVVGDLSKIYRSGRVLRLFGNSAPEGDYRILDSFYTGVVGTPPTAVLVNRTTIELADPLVGSNNFGTIAIYLDAEDDGVNGAHALWQLLFQPYPHGVGLDQALFNMDSLEALGLLCESERLPMSVIAEQGQEAAGCIAAILQDLGVMIGFDNGRWRFKEIREQLGGVPALTDDMIVPPRPQFETSHRRNVTDKTVYTFADRKRNFRDMTVNEDDDGSAAMNRRVRTRHVLIPTAIDYDTAVKVATRREPEDASRPSAKRVNVSRDGRYLFPGQAIEFSGANVRQRVLSITPATLSSRAEVELIDDNYGVPASSGELGDGGGIPDPVQNVEADYAAAIVEVPAYLLTGAGQSIIVPRIRSSAQVLGADIYISLDDSTYTHVARTFKAQTGGTLLEALPASSAVLLEDGPVVQWLGPDAGIVQDLSLDLANWRAGRQVLVASNGVDTEIMFVRNIEALGNDQYRLHGLVRARYDTERLGYLVGHRIFIFRNDEIDEVSDVLLAPGRQIYVKTQPFGTESFPLDAVQAVTTVLVGKGIVPMPCENLRTVNASNSWRSGEDVFFKWTYRSAATPRTGMGMQGFGSPCGVSAPEGSFTLRLMTTGEVVRREIGNLTSTTYQYPNATLVQDFGGSQPSSFLAEIENANGGYKSIARRILVTRVN